VTPAAVAILGTFRFVLRDVHLGAEFRLHIRIAGRTGRKRKRALLRRPDPGNSRNFVGALGGVEPAILRASGENAGLTPAAMSRETFTVGLFFLFHVKHCGSC